MPVHDKKIVKMRNFQREIVKKLKFINLMFLTSSSYANTPSNANVSNKVIALPIAFVSNDIAIITAFIDSGA